MIVLTVLDCKNMCSSGVVLKEYDVVLRCSKCWMMSNDHDDKDDLRRVAREGYNTHLLILLNVAYLALLASYLASSLVSVIYCCKVL